VRHRTTHTIRTCSKALGELDRYHPNTIYRSHCVRNWSLRDLTERQAKSTKATRSGNRATSSQRTFRTLAASSLYVATDAPRVTAGCVRRTSTVRTRAARSVIILHSGVANVGSDLRDCGRLPGPKEDQ